MFKYHIKIWKNVSDTFHTFKATLKKIYDVLIAMSFWMGSAADKNISDVNKSLFGFITRKVNIRLMSSIDRSKMSFFQIKVDLLSKVFSKPIMVITS